jgi:CheY-like chemotaxis protein
MSVNPDDAGPFFYVLREAISILFVDDDPILREFAVVNLATDRASVETAADGRAALAAISGEPPDLVLLDLEMPEMDGFQVLESLRADPRFRDLPVIVVTGREDVEAVDRAFAAGATSFVVKPLNWRLLSHQLRYVHRTAMNERTLAAERGLAQAMVARLAAEGARFIAHALAREPALRPAAIPFARTADTALRADDGAPEPAPRDDDHVQAA